jgi:heterogeneous nuclear ribonucleoprotein A1/A3
MFMSDSKLFVGGLSWNTDDESLRAAFAQHGSVTDAKVVLDRDTGRSRGFGFVTFADPSSAQAAITALDGATLDGRSIRVNVAESKGGGGGGDRGPRQDRRSW